MSTLNIKIIITGHSRGLGWALTEYYGQHRCPVLGISRNLNNVAETNPLPLQQIALDLSDIPALTTWLSGSLLSDFLADADEIVLINNAGSVQPNAILGRQTAAQIAATIALNVTAPLLLSNALMQLKPAQARLKIAHISSGAGRKPYPGWSVYGATKAALDQHALCVAAEQQPSIRIGSIAPGVVGTAMQAEIRQAQAADFPLLGRFQHLANEGAYWRPRRPPRTLPC